MRKAKKLRAARSATAARYSTLRLPALVHPVARRVSTDPLRRRIGASADECADCFAACARLGGPLRPICEQLCKAACG